MDFSDILSVALLRQLPRHRQPRIPTQLTLPLQSHREPGSRRLHDPRRHRPILPHHIVRAEQKLPLRKRDAMLMRKACRQGVIVGVYVIIFGLGMKQLHQLPWH